MVARSNDVDDNFFTPRDYQVELVEKACQGNIIIPLGTGSGKTFIAVLVIKNYVGQLVVPISRGGKRAFFLVDKVSLVDQQATHIECHVTVAVGRMHGSLNVDVWSDKSKFDIFIEQHQVVVLTAQIFLDLIDHGYWSLNDTALIVLDECHHVLGSKHAYRQIMNHYSRMEGDKPRIIGLTASLINNKTPPSSLEQALIKLETIMDCSIETASSLVSVSKYGAKPKEFVVTCDDYEFDKCALSRRVASRLETVRMFLARCNEFHPEFDVDPRKPVMEAANRTLSILKQLGPWCGWKVCQLFHRQLKKHTKQPLLLEKQITLLQVGETVMRASKKILDPTASKARTINDFKSQLPNKVIRLLEILEFFNPENMKKINADFSFCGIVFVEQRYVAYMMNTLIKAIAKLDKQRFGYLTPDFVIGYNCPSIGPDEAFSLHRRQEEVLKKFRQRTLNLLVATSVLEEGVDIRQCNVVVRFDRPSDYRAYIQSKGRARKEDAHYFMLVEESDYAKCASDLKDFSDIEKLLMKRYRVYHNPSGAVASKEILGLDAVVPPYIVPSTGARVNLYSALSLVNRYCAKLPSDIFTRLVPQCRIIPVYECGLMMYKAELLLPINSPVKEVIELKRPMRTKKLAQMAVALEACKALHRRKELNDNLLPVGKDTITLNALDDDPDEYIPNMNYKVGSARRKQLYDKKMAKGLNGILPLVGDHCFIYVMEMNLVREACAQANPKKRKIVNPVDTEFCFGFLSRKRVPNIPSFPVFLRQGKMQANVFLAQSKLYVDADMMGLFQKFHCYLFDNVLRLAKAGMGFAPDIAPVNALIVPLRREKNIRSGEVDFKIDYKYVRNVVSSISDMPRVPTEEERRKFHFIPEKFRDAVVMPWYRDKEQPSFYYVAEILEGTTPSSPFPDEKYLNFNDYFIRKYDLQIYNQMQPLLDVDYTSSRLNLLMPKPLGRPRTKLLDDKDHRVSQGQILVPELVDVHPIAASLWNIIAALPTLLYRINSLLLADELRELIVVEALGGVAVVPDDYVWCPLDYSTPLDDNEVKPVQKIQTIKNEHDEKLAQERLQSQMEGTCSNDEATFEIGVWDPELGRDHETLQLHVQNNEGSKTNDETELDELGLVPDGSVLRHTGDMSDEDGDAVVLFDFMNSMHERLGREKVDIFAPRDNIVSAGWDDLLVHGDVAPINDNIPLFVNSADGSINSRALMADLSKLSWNIGVPNKLLASTNTESSAVINSECSNAGRNNLNESTTSKIIDVARCIQANPMKLYLDSIERLEDSDRGTSKSSREQEEIDLIQFLDADEQKRLVLEAVIPVTHQSAILDRDFGEHLHDAPILMPVRTQVPSAVDGGGSSVLEKEEPSAKISLSDLHLMVQAEQLSKGSQTESTFLERSFFGKSAVTAPVFELMTFDFEKDTYIDHPYGVSPCTLLQALTMSNASDGINLERLETVGDSFLKYAVTDYLFLMNTDQHEGKLSFARSKEVSNCNLYRLGRRHNMPSLMVGSKFDPNDSWLPPCYAPTMDFKAPNSVDAEERDRMMESVLEGTAPAAFDHAVKVSTGWDEADSSHEVRKVTDGVETINIPRTVGTRFDVGDEISPLPYNMLTQQNLSDKSIADVVEALIGAHLLELGPSATLKFMEWLGLKVITEPVIPEDPLLRFCDTNEDSNKSSRQLSSFWVQFQFHKLEDTIGYCFKNKAYLLQAFTHASYFLNRITGCYQRLEFLGDAVLDYIITRFLFEHPRKYSPGVLTDLRSALVNNTIFASLAVKYNFHKHFVAMCPRLYHMIEKFVHLCKEKDFSGANFNAEMYMVTTEEEIDEGEEEDIEVPKAMGDIFESVAGAIYLDSGRHLNVVWRVFYNLMRETIEECCSNPPRSPVRELLELEPERARFSKLERILETGKVRVTVDIQGKCRFTGMGRSYRIAKCTAAKRALRYLKSLKEEKEKNRK